MAEDRKTFGARGLDGSKHKLEFVPATPTRSAHFRTSQGFVVVQVGPDTFDILSGPVSVTVTAVSTIRLADRSIA
jgi:hypothetical protein